MPNVNVYDVGSGSNSWSSSWQPFMTSAATTNSTILYPASPPPVQYYSGTPAGVRETDLEWLDRRVREIAQLAA